VSDEKEPKIHDREGDLFRNEKKSPCWYFEYRDSKGQRHRLSTGESDYSKAVRAKKTLLEKIHNQENPGLYRHLVLPNLEKWISMKSKSWSDGTTVDVKGKTKVFVEFSEGKALDEINEVSWDEFIGWMNESYPGRRIAKIQDYVSSFLKAMFHEGKIKRIPILRNPDQASDVGRSLSDEEVLALEAEINSPILRLQVWMQLKMGMRSGEVLLLEKDRIDLKAEIIKLRAPDTKTRTARVVPIHPDVLPLIKDQMKASEGSYFLFPSPIDVGRSVGLNGNRTAWLKLLKRAGIKCRRHDLRHTCATKFARDNISPMIAARILGMSLEVYDRIYCKPTDDDLKGVFR
jgi:integrase